MQDFTFYLGSPEPSWLSTAGVPLMVSRRRTMRIAKIKPAIDWWLLDSSGYTELDLHGCWMLGDDEYVDEVYRCSDKVGMLRGAAIKDWMCEDSIREKTGKTVREHQERTVESYLSLRGKAPELPWVPVLQGWEAAEYITCVELYQSAGVDLRSMPIVGVGTMCRRQATSGAVEVLEHLASMGLKLHGFGFKTDGIEAARPFLSSADSLAWSRDARYSHPMDECSHSNCANCIKYALAWRKRVLWRAGVLPAGGIEPSAVYRSKRKR